MSKLDHIIEMYRSHPISLSIRSLRHRPYFRHGVYAFVGFVALVFLWSLYPRRDSLILPPEVETDIPEVSPEVWEERAQRVKQAYIHAYSGYERLASPHDELRPVSGGYVDNFNGWGVSIVDGLDTMLLLGLKDEYRRALEQVEKIEFNLDEAKVAPYFETVIRYLGGLLSAYAISPDDILLKRADELAEKLDPVFDTPSGLPRYGINPSTGKVEGPEIGILAEIASLQMEYTTLAKLTGKKKWMDRVNTVVQALAKGNLKDTGGMLPIGWNLTNAQPNDARLSAGAQADSAHEYLLKQYLLTAKTDKTNLEMYIRATTHMIANLMYLSPTRHLLYITDSDASNYETRARPTHAFEHLSCFLPGLLALGAHTLPLDNLASVGISLEELASRDDFGDAGHSYRLLGQYNLKDLHMWAAQGLAQTCWITYADQPTGLGPDEMKFTANFDRQTRRSGYLWMDAVESWKKSGARGVPPGVEDKKAVRITEEMRLKGDTWSRDYAMKKTGYLLRPETIESLYILWRITGDVKWRHYGWRIFNAIELNTKTQYGYASLRTVERMPPVKEDDMPSSLLSLGLWTLLVDEEEMESAPIISHGEELNTTGYEEQQYTTREKGKSKALEGGDDNGQSKVGPTVLDTRLLLGQIPSFAATASSNKRGRGRPQKPKTDDPIERGRGRKKKVDVGTNSDIPKVKWKVVNRQKARKDAEALGDQLRHEESGGIPVCRPGVWCSSKFELLSILPELSGKACVNGISWTQSPTPVILLDGGSGITISGMDNEAITMDIIMTRDFECLPTSMCDANGVPLSLPRTSDNMLEALLGSTVSISAPTTQRPREGKGNRAAASLSAKREVQSSPNRHDHPRRPIHTTQVEPRAKPITFRTNDASQGPIRGSEAQGHGHSGTETSFIIIQEATQACKNEFPTTTKQQGGQGSPAKTKRLTIKIPPAKSPISRNSRHENTLRVAPPVKEECTSPILPATSGGSVSQGPAPTPVSSRKRKRTDGQHHTVGSRASKRLRHREPSVGPLQFAGCGKSGSGSPTTSGPLIPKGPSTINTSVEGKVTRPNLSVDTSIAIGLLMGPLSPLTPLSPSPSPSPSPLSLTRLPSERHGSPLSPTLRRSSRIAVKNGEEREGMQSTTLHIKRGTKRKQSALETGDQVTLNGDMHSLVEQKASTLPKFKKYKTAEGAAPASVIGLSQAPEDGTKVAYPAYHQSPSNDHRSGHEHDKPVRDRSATPVPMLETAVLLTGPIVDSTPVLPVGVQADGQEGAHEIEKQEDIFNMSTSTGVTQGDLASHHISRPITEPSDALAPATAHNSFVESHPINNSVEQYSVSQPSLCVPIDRKEFEDFKSLLDSGFPLGAPEEVQVLDLTFKEGTLVLPIITRELFGPLSMRRIPEEFRYMYVGYWQVVGTQKTRVKASSRIKPGNGQSHFVMGRVQWSFKLRWHASGEEDLGYPNLPWWNPFQPAISRLVGSVERLSLSQGPEKSKDEFVTSSSSLPCLWSPSLLMPGPDNEEGPNSGDDRSVRGWYCSDCGKLNRQTFWRRRKCGSSFCKDKPITSCPVRRLDVVRERGQQQPMVLPINTQPNFIDPLISEWNDGIKTITSKFSEHSCNSQDGVTCTDAWAKHIFTGNLSYLQEDQTQLFEDMQRDVIFERKPLDTMPYFTYAVAASSDTFSLAKSFGTLSVSCDTAPKCMANASDLLLHISRCYGETDVSRVLGLVALAWSTNGRRKGDTCLVAKHQTIVIMNLGCDTVIDLLPHSSSTISPSKIPPTPVPSPIKTEVQEEPSLNVASDWTQLIPLEPEPDEQEDKPSLVTEPQHMNEVASTLEIVKTQERHQKTSKVEISKFTLVHGDSLILAGDDFEYTIQREGTSILLLGVLA
ncbi:hypothetical protein VNI00_002811 [Paramarasmius palmivorus]|uniref:alpha-1,2-Mannosidase n=1 Tax=Paramarasmius palmivorus TaxID=297713 RepID=A0AAW0DWD6_9AGAR